MRFSSLDHSGQKGISADAMPRRPTQWFILAILPMALVALLGLADPRVRGLAINTMLLCTAVIAIALPLALLLALPLSRTDLPGRRLLLLAVVLLLFTPLYLQAAAWEAGFGLQGALLPITGGWPLIVGWLGSIWIHAMASIGWAVLLITVGLCSVERRLEELALLDYSASWVLWRVTMRRAMPAVAVAAIWTTLLTAGEMTVTNLFQVRTFAEELYTQLSFGESLLAISLSGLPSWLFTISLVLVGVAVVNRFMARVLHSGHRPLIFSLDRWRLAVSIAIWALIAILIAVPLVSLIDKAGLTVVAVNHGQRERIWSLGKCCAMIVGSPIRFGRELFWSFTLGIGAASLALVLAVVFAWWARCSSFGRAAALLLAAAGLAIPAPVVGLILINLMNRAELPALVWLYDQTIAAPLAALLVRSTPIAILIVWSSLMEMPNQLFELARLDGISALRQFTQIVLPLRWRALAAAWLAALAVALGDLSATILVLPPGVETMALRMFERLHFGAEDQVAGASLALLGFFGATGGLAAWLFSGTTQRGILAR